MILIADSGATKTDWILMDQGGEAMSLVTPGLNPFYLDSKQIIKILNKELIPFIESKKINEIYFYGAGCASVYKAMTVEDALVNLFRNASIKIESDLFGAARALFGNREGIACILGTGSNSCHYDGNKIIENVASLGYFFGDEGSGAHMGRIFIKDYLTGSLPKEIHDAFKKEYNYSRDNILDAVYNLPFPNRYLASFCSFYADHLSNKYIYQLVTDSFREFFINQLEKYSKYKDVPVSFVGSVSYYFEYQLRQIAIEFEVNVGRLLRSPIKALAEFHMT